jgi:hypothetical protein
MVGLSCSYSAEDELSASHTPMVKEPLALGASYKYVSLKHISVTSVFVGSEALVAVTRRVLFSWM